jgi:Holliday junction resolvasome RuvABC endonuclease subunit
MLKFVAIDSSLANTGVAIGSIDPLGKPTVHRIALVETEKSKNKQVRASTDTIDRCRQTFKFVDQILKEEKPHVIFVETPQGSQSSAAMKSYGATCQLIASLIPAPIEVTPNEVKMGSVNLATANKTTMINWAHKLYPNLEWFINRSTGELQNKNEHLADAIAIVHAGVKTAQFEQLRAMMFSRG